MSTHRTHGSCVVLAALVVCATLAVPVFADVGPMEVKYLQDFENGSNGWTLDPFTRGDDLRVDVDPMQELPRTDNHALVGKSPDPAKRCGFRAESPTFDAMGVDTTLPYQISFRYGLPEVPACWTYALASKHVSLVVTECNVDAGFAELAFVDELANTVEEIGRIDLWTWNDIEALVVPHPNGKATVRVRLNGVVQGFFERTNPSGFDRLVFWDLPFRYTDASDGPEFPLEPSAFVAADAWDDIVVRAEIQEDVPPPRNIKPHMNPNPFNPRTVLYFSLDREASVRIDLFDVSGRQVRSLFDGRLPAGPQALPWDGRDDARANVASGVYLVRTVVDGETTVTRATVVR